MIEQPKAVYFESTGAALGKNLSVARLLAGVTQHTLANLSGVSRATVAQLETGISDPRLSTIVDLAKALQISPIALLMGSAEINALTQLRADLADRPVELSPTDIRRMELLVQSGMLSDRSRAARIGAAAAQAVDGVGPGAMITAGILSTYAPGDGTVVGISLGRLLDDVRER
jgi:transcriptional regulator with XRE-family HTH domain